MVDVALPLEHDPKSVDTEPEQQSDQSKLIEKIEYEENVNQQ